MPTVRDRCEIRAILRRDPAWSLFALGDLTPGYFEHADWFRPASGAPALAMIYRAFATPVLFTIGDPTYIRELMDEIGEPTLYLHVRPEILPVVEVCYTVPTPKSMWRMVLDPARFVPADHADVLPLGPADLDALRTLYEDGAAAGEAPEFFLPSMLGGFFYGIREGGALVAVAGTQLLAPSEGVAAIGNVYTRRDRRGRGLASAVTSAVAGELLRMGIPTVALNVGHDNPAAIRVYERLGFTRYCAFREGLARLSPGPGLVY